MYELYGSYQNARTWEFRDELSSGHRQSLARFKLLSHYCL